MEHPPRRRAQGRRFGQSLKFCQTEIQRIIRTLGLRQLSKIYLVRLMQKTPDQEKKFVRGLIEKLLKLVESKKDLSDQSTALEAKTEHGYENIRVTVRDKIYAGVQIRIGQESLEIEKDMGAVEVYKVDWGIELAAAGE